MLNGQYADVGTKPPRFFKTSEVFTTSENVKVLISFINYQGIGASMTTSEPYSYVMVVRPPTP